MFRRRRRKPRVLWLPQPGTQAVGSAPGPNEPEENWAGIFFTQRIDGNQSAPTTVSSPMVIDNPTTTGPLGASFANWQGGNLQTAQEPGYRLRRIVGDLFVTLAQDPDQSSTPLCGALVECGIIVRKVDQDGQPTAGPAEEDVGSIQNNADPWVWRRNWLLSTGDTIAPAVGSANIDYWGTQFYPLSNWGYGNSRQHVDQKTARRVGPEERLFFDVTVWPQPFNHSALGFDNLPPLYVTFDYRVLATLTMNSGNRRNSSR